MEYGRILRGNEDTRDIDRNNNKCGDGYGIAVVAATASMTVTISLQDGKQLLLNFDDSWH